MTGTTKVLIVDDAVVVRGLVSRFVNAEDDLEVIGAASDGKAAVDRVRALKPDVVVLDIEMPIMDGITALTEIRKFDPKVPVIMFSTLTASGAQATLRALAAGASDYATKPEYASDAGGALKHVQDELITKIRALAKPTVPTVAPRTATPAPRPRRNATGLPPRAVVIGSSTGGPRALEQVLIDVGDPLPVPVAIVQHMPATFTKALADRLDKKCPSRVIEVDRPVVAEAGSVYLAAGGRHLRMVGSGTDLVVEPFDADPINSCRPSVETLFASAAEVCGSRLIAAVLTGMGADGAAGARTIADLGCEVIVQDEATSVVWGMPGAVVHAGAATAILPLQQIGRRIADHARTAGPGARRHVPEEVVT